MQVSMMMQKPLRCPSQVPLPTPLTLHHLHPLPPPASSPPHLHDLVDHIVGGPHALERFHAVKVLLQGHEQAIQQFTRQVAWPVNRIHVPFVVLSS